MTYHIEYRDWDMCGEGFYIVDQDGDAHGPFISRDAAQIELDKIAR